MTPKTYRLLMLAAAFACCLVHTGCKKDNEKENGALNSIIGKWRMTGYIHNGADVFGNGVGECVIDDIITFKAGNQFVNDEGPTKCDPSDPQTITGTYTLSADKTQLTVSVTGYSETDTVKTLNATTLQLEQQSNGDLVTYTRIP